MGTPSLRAVARNNDALVTRAVSAQGTKIAHHWRHFGRRVQEIGDLDQARARIERVLIFLFICARGVRVRDRCRMLKSHLRCSARAKRRMPCSNAWRSKSVC